MAQGSATIEIAADPAAVFATISDVTRMGEWSPECVAVRWAGGATGPGLGVTFEGDNEARFLGLTVKRWTTTSEITAFEPGEVFEFVTEGYTTWTYRLRPTAGGTEVTESYAYAPAPGRQAFLYEKVLARPAGMVKGMQRTLERIKQTVEGA